MGTLPTCVFVVHARDETTQVNTFLYAMGKEAEDILPSLKLAGIEMANYAAVKRKFKRHFIPCMNIIYERARFNWRVQQPSESVEAFITDLHKLSETCECGELLD